MRSAGRQQRGPLLVQHGPQRVQQRVERNRRDLRGGRRLPVQPVLQLGQAGQQRRQQGRQLGGRAGDDRAVGREPPPPQIGLWRNKKDGGRKTRLEPGLRELPYHHGDDWGEVGGNVMR